jgi:hypothetical protein
MDKQDRVKERKKERRKEKKARKNPARGMDVCLLRELCLVR